MVQIRADGSIDLSDGLTSLPEGGVWSADDRILAFSTQQSGGLERLLYHGRQPQSANTFLLQSPDGALVPWLRVQDQDGIRKIRHEFGRVSVRPFGWMNEFDTGGLRVRSELCAQGSSLVMRMNCLNLTHMPLSVQILLHLNRAALHSDVNGWREWRVQETRQGCLRLLAHDRLQTSTWIIAPGFRDYFIDTETWILIAGEQGCKSLEDGTIALTPEEIAAGKQGSDHFFFVVCAASVAAAECDLHRLQANPMAPYQKQKRRYAGRIPAARLHVAGFPVGEAIYHLAPAYAEAAKLRGTGALRSSSGGYYFVWGWDSLMFGHELARLGDAEAAVQLMEFFATHRAPDGSLPHRFDNDLQPLQVTGYDFTSMLFISMLYQYFSETVDRLAFDRYYPLARDIFKAISLRTDQRGFCPSLGMYPDDPERLGRKPTSMVSYEVGYWYTTCRMMTALARLQGEEMTAQAAERLAGQIYDAYLSAFLDSETGFLVDSVNPPGDRPNHTYPRYALFPLHNAFGAWLLYPARMTISRFLQAELFMPDGIRMVPTWDKCADSETVTGACWFLHFDLYTLKAFRRAGDGAAIQRWLRLANSFFQHRHVIPELQMLALQGDEQSRWSGSVGQIWQLFAISGWTKGLLEGVLGLETDLGGLTYIPCDNLPAASITGFPFRGGWWDVATYGQGPWVKRMILDGEPFVGSLKLPLECYTAKPHRLEIVLTATRPTFPCILEVVGGALSHPVLHERTLTTQISGHGEVNLIYYSPTQPHILVNDRPQASQWSENTGVGTATLTIIGEEELVIEL